MNKICNFFFTNYKIFWYNKMIYNFWYRYFEMIIWIYDCIAFCEHALFMFSTCWLYTNRLYIRSNFMHKKIDILNNSISSFLDFSLLLLFVLILLLMREFSDDCIIDLACIKHLSSMYWKYTHIYLIQSFWYCF